MEYFVYITYVVNLMKSITKIYNISTLRFHNGLTHNLDKMSYALQNMYRHVPDHILNERIARPIAVEYITVFLIWPKLRT